MNKIVEEVSKIKPSKIYLDEVETIIQGFSMYVDYPIYGSHWAVGLHTKPRLFSKACKSRVENGCGCITQIAEGYGEAEFKYLTKAIKADERISDLSFNQLSDDLKRVRSSPTKMRRLLMPYAQWQTYIDRKLKRSMGNEVGIGVSARKKIVS